MLQNNQITKKRVAILIENGLEEVAFKIPYQALKSAGFEVNLLGRCRHENYVGNQGNLNLQADSSTTEAQATQFDAVLIPGGVAPDLMRTNFNTVRFVQAMMAQQKLIAAISHGPQLLIEGDLLQNKLVTGCASIRKDLMNAGAHYVNEPVVIDSNLITARHTGDLGMFTTAVLNYLGYGGKDEAFPDYADPNAEWWKLATVWGGSKKGEIVNGLNMILGTERYFCQAFECYAEITTDSELHCLLIDMTRNKMRHIKMLEVRLEELGELPYYSVKNDEKYAKFKPVTTGTDESFLLGSTLDAIQVSIAELNDLRFKFTDPVTTQIFNHIHTDLVNYEQCLAALFKNQMLMVR